MAPPADAPPATGSTAAPPAESVSTRLIKLAKTLQFAWFTGHVFVLVGVLFYVLSAIRFAPGTSWARFWYRETYFSVIATYGIVLYRSYRASTPTATTIIRDDNVQYLFIALLWLISKPLLITLPPFAIYSFFHVLTYTRTNLLPTLGQPTTTGPAAQIQSFVDNYNDKFTALVGNLELVLLVRLFFNAILFRKGSWISLIIYGAFIRLRFEQSAFTRQAVKNWEVRADSLIAHPSVPAGVKNGWEKAKATLKGGSAVPPVSKTQ
ncbi:hypothetical protein BZA70DRAFT_272139 [Myxozyma melibiosi]|uniref:Endoplasmic reticulum protein n=1 Tax=Myxozyma melibiosi TaxID=54550 RepID=A0ABR1FD21_9ASCO